MSEKLELVQTHGSQKARTPEHWSRGGFEHWIASQWQQSVIWTTLHSYTVADEPQQLIARSSNSLGLHFLHNGTWVCLFC